MDMNADSFAKPLRRFSLLASVMLGSLVFTGCAADTPAEPEPMTPSAEATPEVVEEPAPAGLEDTDFGNLTWVFRPGGSVPETQRVDLVDGVASDGMVSYELGEVILTELTGDDQIDAAAQITRLDGNAIDEQWYIWIATDDGPVQSTLPIARMARCGTVIHSVTAVDGGIEIHETLRRVGDESIPCSDPGSDERTRTVSAIEARNVGEWWPVQTAPFGGFGGLCPMNTHLDAYPNDFDLYPVPDTAASETISFEGASGIFEIDAWPVYGEPFPGWVLVGVQQGDARGCAWAERS